MDQDLQNYMDYIKEDYFKWRKDMKSDNSIFEVSAAPGSKYIKIIITSYGSSSVHSFVCAKDTNFFKKGDILKANSWKAPAVNFARGNIYDKKFDEIRWTGC